jgi:hypothetical protein
MLLPHSIHSTEHVLVVIDLVLHGFFQDAFIIIDDLIQFDLVLVGLHGLFQIVLQLELVKSVRVHVTNIKLVETRACQLAIVTH